MFTRFALETSSHNSVHEITQQVKQAVANSGIKSGCCIVFVPHTTAALTLTSFWDPAGFEDIQDTIDRLVPTRIDFHHQHDTPRDAAGHVKSTLIDVTQVLIVEGGKLALGGSQGLFFLEFDGPRKREVFVKVMGD